MLTINEIFYSIQGESTFAGQPCVFVRLTACDLRCSWCDTQYAFHDGQKRSLSEVIKEIESYKCQLVEITGGEPLLQDDVYPLMTHLSTHGCTVLLETGGHHSTGRVPSEVITILDVKCPGSGESDRNDLTNLNRLRQGDELKFVIKDREDYDFACDVMQRYAVAERATTVHFSPVHGVLDPKQLSEWILADRLQVRLQLQAHKYIWGSTARSV
jgi:7-carboxy-7-deazaguanine synthase